VTDPPFGILNYLSLEQVAERLKHMNSEERLRWQVHILCDIDLRGVQALTEDDCRWILDHCWHSLTTRRSEPR
jgi:hypothetical protein